MGHLTQQKLLVGSPLFMVSVLVLDSIRRHLSSVIPTLPFARYMSTYLGTVPLVTPVPLMTLVLIMVRV